MSSPEAALRRCWQSLGGAAHPDTIERVLIHHREPHRHYHTAVHVMWVLRHVDDLLPVAPGAVDAVAVRAAALFHDVIYDPRSATNEADSARFASEALGPLGWDPRRIARVAALIEATAAHDAGEPHADTSGADLGPADAAASGRADAAASGRADAAASGRADAATTGRADAAASGRADAGDHGAPRPEPGRAAAGHVVTGRADHGAPRSDAGRADAAVLLDADLAILGAQPVEYAAYVAAVRAEFRQVDPAGWRTGRATVLRSFLDRPVIYATPAMRLAREGRARINLSAELASLG